MMNEQSTIALWIGLIGIGTMFLAMGVIIAFRLVSTRDKHERWKGIISNSVIFVILGFSTYYGKGMVEQNHFLNSPEATSKGFIGRSFLEGALKRSADSGCNNVSRADEKPLLISLGSDGTAVCGMSHEALASEQSLPFIEVDENYIVKVGQWPFGYKLVFPAKLLGMSGD